jgi:membrane protein required for colicin V production
MINPFDAVVLGICFVALVTGFASGLLRSLATILAYAVAVPVTLAASPAVTAWLRGQRFLPEDRMTLLISLAPFLMLIAIGIVLGALMRNAVRGVTGGHMVLADRMLGAVLGVARVALLAVAFILLLEQIVPPGREPDWLKQSQLRPYLSAAGAAGLRALPPEALDYVERLKRESGI